MGIQKNGVVSSGMFDSQYSASIKKGFTLNPNIFINSKFESTYESTNKGLGTGVYAYNWGGYNGGISNPTENYHACIDSTTFGENVYMFNESNGLRLWKGIKHNVTNKLGTTNHTISMDVYQTISGGKLFGGFHYTKEGNTSGSFASGYYNITNDMISVGKWSRVSAVVPFNNDVKEGSGIVLYIYGFGFSSNTIVYIKNLKLEVGEKVTPWCYNSSESNYLAVDNKDYSSCFIANDFIEY